LLPVRGLRCLLLEEEEDGIKWCGCRSSRKNRHRASRGLEAGQPVELIDPDGIVIEIHSRDQPGADEA
jgi:hypothetical protein